jgi:hypothetical protein
MQSKPISVASSLKGIKLNLFAWLRRQAKTSDVMLNHSFSFTLHPSFLLLSLSPLWMIFNDQLRLAPFHSKEEPMFTIRNQEVEALFIVW